MRQGGWLLIGAAVLACTACQGNDGKLEIRSIDRGLKNGHEPVPFRIAEARGHLALGNVALALEGFRKAARDDPASIEAQAGIADCYLRIGRYDLSRRHYEMALAIAPRDPALLGAFAASLEVQGKGAEAAKVRGEIAALAAAQPAESIEPTAPVQAVATMQAEPAPLVAPAPIGQSVTIALPPPRPAPRVVEQHKAPRLERLSLTEVALVTGDGPRWKRPDTQALRMAARAVLPKAAEIRLLNAARVDKLAARTGAYLGNFGWRRIELGDAAVTRSRSLIVYPKGTQAAARRLSARLGFAIAPRNDVRQLTVLLGRDAAAHPALRRGS